MAAPAPAPAPVPASPDSNCSMPVAPKLSEKLCNRGRAARFFIHVKQKSHGKQWIAKCLENKGFFEITSGFLPHPKCVFYWLQREYAFFADELFSDKQNKPCISFTPSQGILCEKSKFASNLYSYYGDDAWKITPMTFDCDYDEKNEEWMISSKIKQLIESKCKDYVWIVKNSFGSLGNGVFLYRGNTLKSFQEFVNDKYKPTNWGKNLAASGWFNTDKIKLRSIILQEYVDKPLLYNNNYKFDLRVYCLIASTNPCILFFHIGKMRVCGVQYNKNINIMNDDEEIYKYGHISNCKIQRSHDNYDHQSSSINGQTMLLDWDGFIQFIYDIAIHKKQFKKEWFEKYQFMHGGINQMTLQDMKELIDIKCCRLFEQLYSASKSHFDNDSVKYNRPCQFMFQGNDIIIDQDGKFDILEVNRCPSLSLIGYQSIKDMTKNMLKEMVDICLEIRELKIKNIKVDQDTPLKSPHYWIKCKLDYKKPMVDRIDDLICDLNTLLK